MRTTLEKRLRFLLPSALGLLFFGLYASCGVLFVVRAPGLFRYLDQLFDADIPSRVFDLTRPQGGHAWTRLHPLFVLLLNPLGFAARELLRRAGLEGLESARLAAVVLTAAAGGLTVAFFCVLVRRLGLASAPAVAWSVVFGLSSSQLVFASFPESFAFSALSLVFLFAQGARPSPPRDRLVAAGVLSFGMVVTNLVAAVLVRARWLDVRRPLAALRSLAAYGLLVVGVTALLSLVQLVVYPGSASFLQPEPVGFAHRTDAVWPRDGAEVVERAIDVAAHLAWFNLAAPRLLVTETASAGTRVDFASPSPVALRPAGMGHVLLWAALLAAVLVTGTGRRVFREPVPMLLALWIAFNAGLHMVVGASLFLYASQWTFAVVALAATGSDRLAGTASRRRAILVLVVLLVVLQAVDNACFLRDLLALYARR
jgi:hypothetical protein